MTTKRQLVPQSAPQSLGEYLANIRASKQMKLREVEEVTGRTVSNAYLSQLENGRIGKPSPNILHSLAKAYAVPYELLMEKAGYVMAASDRVETAKHGRVATFADKSLTREEEEALLSYLAFLRSKRSKR